MSSLEDRIIFIVDKGITRSLLVNAFTDPKSVHRDGGVLVAHGKVVNTINHMVHDGYLEQDNTQGAAWLKNTWKKRTAPR